MEQDLTVKQVEQVDQEILHQLVHHKEIQAEQDQVQLLVLEMVEQEAVELLL